MCNLPTLILTTHYVWRMNPPAMVTTGLEFGDPVFAQGVRDSVARIEDLIETELTRGDELLCDAALRLFRVDGERFRPLFTILSAQLGSAPDAWQVTVAGAVVEMVHLATLYHHNVLDEPQMRRGGPSANARWSNNIGILAGDYLFSTSARLAARLGPESVFAMAQTLAHLVTGQVREIFGAAGGVDPIEHYLRIVHEKSGSLFAASARWGARFAGACDEHIEQLSRLGEIAGTAFHISNDIIDITSDSHGSGSSTPRTDRREAAYTLPVLYALREGGPDADRLRKLLNGPMTDGFHVTEALALVRSSPGMAKAREMLARYAAQARKELASLPDGEGRNALDALVVYIVNRQV